jgi:hypothetical protein
LSLAADERATPLPRRTAVVAALRREPTAATASLVLVGLALISALVRVVFVSRIHAPTVFNDELGYVKLAESLGRTGRLALLDNPGASYSPLYPLVLSPIYALGASAPTAYALIKIVNACLLSLAVIPTYKIARFVLPRRFSLLVAGLTIVAPLMTYTSFTMSENLAYPLCLVAIWAMLEAVCRPSVRSDALLLAAIGLATVARIQLIVLLPAALTAMLVVALGAPPSGESRIRSLLRSGRQHVLLLAVLGGGVLVAAAGSLVGHDVLSVLGRYSNVFRRGLPDIRTLLDLLLRHIAGIDLAVGVAPFVAALGLTVVFFRSRRSADQIAFAAVAACVTAWFVVEVAIEAALFDSPNGDVPRIHERFLIYVVPFFLVALVAGSRLRESKSLPRIFLAAALVAALLPAAIPFATVVNATISVDTFGLEPFARIVAGDTTAIPHATIAAVWISATLALLYVYVRRRLRTVVLLILLPFVAYSGLARVRIEGSSAFGRSLLPAHADWVDRARPSGDVVLVSAGESAVPALQTLYSNLEIDRIYYLCRPVVGSDFGERAVAIDRAGRVRDGSQVVRAKYAVVPWSLAVRGRVPAWNGEGGQALVELRNGRLTVPVWNRHVDCSVARARR